MKHLARLCDVLTIPISESSSLVERAEDPRWRQWFLHKMGQTLYARLLGAASRVLLPRPTLITDRDWDHLIVLDACRYDTFREVYSEFDSLLPRESRPLLDSIISPGSETLTWVKANLVQNPGKGSLEDVIWVTANPRASEEFFHLKGWEFPLAACVSAWKHWWDPELESVHPRDMVKAVSALSLVHERKGLRPRYLVHFLQPHAPFIGESRIGIDQEAQRTFEEDHGFYPGGLVWWLLANGGVTSSAMKQAYEANLALGLEWALKLAKVLKGRVVITSDHGNLFGEYGLFHHPVGVHVPELVQVPWLELKGGGGDPGRLLDELDGQELDIVDLMEELDAAGA